MAKIRGIKPETWTDDKFVRLSPLARLMFIGMWNLACDNGHVEDNAMQLKIRLLPVDNCDVSALIEETIEVGQVERHDGYLKVVKLPEHQHIDLRWLSLCEWCEHDEHTTYTKAQKRPRKKGARSAQDERQKGTPLVLDADGDGDGDGELKVTPPSPDGEAFDEFWTRYPRKEGKGAARKAWAKAVKQIDATELINITRSYGVRMHGAEKRFIPHPATWLNQERWSDEVEDQKTEAADEWFQPFTLPECPPAIADDPERYAAWVEDQRDAWRQEGGR